MATAIAHQRNIEKPVEVLSLTQNYSLVVKQLDFYLVTQSL
jgi:hypothetical protein